MIVDAASDQHIEQHKECYASGVLDPNVHMRLVNELESVAQDANVPKHMIYTKASDYCSDEEMDWLTAYNHLPMEYNGGMVYVGGCGDVGVRMFAAASALLRNFIRGRVFTVQEVISAEKRGTPIDATVLLIPNFHYSPKSGGSVPDWQTSMLLGMLYSRYASEKKTILYVEDMHQLKEEYGEPFYSHITAHFKQIIK